VSLSACEPREFGEVSKLSFTFRAHSPVGLVFADDVDAVSGLGFVVKLCSSVDCGM
jgi:hypothetical protein